MKVNQTLQRLIAAGPLALIGVGLVSAMILISFVAMFGGSRSEQERLAFEGSQLEEREQVMKNVKITRTAGNLQVNYMIESSQLTQYPERQVSELVSPRLVESRPDGSSRIISAPMGTYYQGANEIELIGGVKITEIGTDNTQNEMTISAETLTIDLE